MEAVSSYANVGKQEALYKTSHTRKPPLTSATQKHCTKVKHQKTATDISNPANICLQRLISRIAFRDSVQSGRHICVIGHDYGLRVRNA
jgi:hypothetical protein